MTAMTKTEREDLSRLLNRREKAQKSAAKLRSAQLMADFENQMASVFSFDADEVWAAASKAADKVVAEANATIAARCRELGIPERFAPSLSLRWVSRGYDNQVEARRKELRRVAQARTEALEREALVTIENDTVNALTEMVSGSLESEAARAFLEKLPTVEQLMPALSYDAIAGRADPPVEEQLLTPKALRQQEPAERPNSLLALQATG